MSQDKPQEKRKSIYGTLGRALSIKTGQMKPITIYLNKTDNLEVFLQPKDTLKDAFKIIEAQKKIKLDPAVYQFKSDSGIVINIASQIKSVPESTLYLAPPYDLSERSKLFGKSLVTVMKQTSNAIPIVLVKCFDFLDKERALRTIGLFRLNGHKDDVRKLRTQLEEATDDFEIPSNTEPNVVTGVVKKFFRSLQDPLIPYEFYLEFINISDIEDEPDRTKKLKDAIAKIPLAHFKVLRFLMEYLVKLCMYSQKNLITPSNISIVFGPLLLRERPKSDVEASKKKKEVLARIPQELKNKYTRLIGASMIENFGAVFGIDEQTEGSSSKKANDDSSSTLVATTSAPAANNSGETLKGFVALMKKNIAKQHLTQEEPSSPTTLGELTKSFARPRIGTVHQNMAPSTPPPLDDKPSTTTALPPPIPEDTNPETSKTWMKFADEWKKRYNDEVAAREKDRSDRDRAEKEWDELFDSYKKQITILKTELDQLKQTTKHNDEKHRSENQQLQLDYEAIKKQKQDDDELHEKQIRDMKREHLLLLKKYGIDPTAIDPANQFNPQKLSPRNAQPEETKPSPRFTPRRNSVLSSEPPAAEKPVTKAPVPALNLEKPEQTEGTTDKKIDVSSRFKSSNTNESQAPLNTESTSRFATKTEASKPQEEPVDPSKVCYCCKKVISGAWFEANSKKFHNECFACTNCKEIIKGPFADRDGQLWCKECLQNKQTGTKVLGTKAADSAPATTSSTKPASTSKKPICAMCDEEITPGDKILALAKAYHKACFRCQQCGSEFENMKFFNLDNQPVCANCKKKKMKQ